jgi:hypothetical protein
VAQILVEYCEPPVTAHVMNVPYHRKTLGVIQVEWNGMFPYFARRDLGSTLAVGVGYIRRDSTIGRLTPAEIEYLMRAKASRLGPIIAQEPLLCGFVNYGHFTGPHGPILRVTNVSDATVNDIRVLFDVTWTPDPRVFTRQPSWGGPLNAGGSREVELDLRNLYLPTSDGKGVSSAGDKPKWLDVTARVHYRDRNGLVSEIQARSIVVD